MDIKVFTKDDMVIEIDKISKAYSDGDFYCLYNKTEQKITKVPMQSIAFIEEQLTIDPLSVGELLNVVASL